MSEVVIPPSESPDPERRSIEELKSYFNDLNGLPYSSRKPIPALPLGIGPIDALLNGGLAGGCVHEISGAALEDAAAYGFATHLLAAYSMRGPVVWIVPRRDVIYAPGLAGLGLHPGRLLVVEAPQRPLRLWALAEALRWDGAAAVLAEIDPVDFNISRRLQLAAAASQVSALLLHEGPRRSHASAARTRWHVTSAHSRAAAAKAGADAPPALAGLGPPRWRLELLRGPAARSGAWVVEHRSEGLTHVQTIDLERPAPTQSGRQHGVVIARSRPGGDIDASRDAPAQRLAAVSGDRSRPPRGA
jgi:protein ImuA